MFEVLEELKAIAVRVNYDTCKTQSAKDCKAMISDAIVKAIENTIKGATKEELAALVSKMIVKNKDW